MLFSSFGLPLLLLLSLSLSSAGSLDLVCSEKQYKWPYENPRKCCDKCPPGSHMDRDPDHSCQNQCVACVGDRYTETYNVKTHCIVCDTCSKPNMRQVSNCSPTRNTVCGCTAGYRCRDPSCSACDQIPSSPPPPTATPGPPNKDSLWFLVITGLLAAGLTLLLATKLKSFLRWLRSRQGYNLPEKVAPLPPEDEDVSKPVQEVCGKCEQPIDLCMKV